MKRIICLGILLVGSICFSQTIEFEKETIDYGTIKKGSNKERVFKFKNTGDKPLILTEVTASCGCTVPSFPKDPILPNKSAEIKVTYDTNRLGNFTKPITVLSNDPEKARVVVNIKGSVVEN